MKKVCIFLFKRSTLLISLILFFSSSIYGMNEEVEKTPAKLYNLSENKVAKNVEKKPPYLTCAKIAQEDFYLDDKFISHTQNIIKRENELRKSYKIPEKLNVAQFCFYGFYNDNTVKIYEEVPFTNCQGVFYLSGNEPSNYVKDSKNIKSDFNVQTIKINEKPAKIIQRAQPIAKSIESTLSHLLNVQKYVNNCGQKINELKNNAEYKAEELSIFKNKQKEIILRLSEIEKKNVNVESQIFSLEESLNLAMSNLAKEVKASLEVDDFNFNLLGEIKNNKSINPFLEKIKLELCDVDLNRSSLNINKKKKKILGEIFNSKYFNLGCSEQLFLYDIGIDIRRNFLAQRVILALNNKELKSIWLQLHTTKTPCKACLLGCCGHLKEEYGWINLLFKEITKKTTKPIYLVISYEKPYVDEDGYGFYVPMEGKESNIQDILLINTAESLFPSQFSEIEYYDIIN